MKEQLSLFSTAQEKGSREWATFDAVREVKPGMFRVMTPKPRETVQVRPRRVSAPRPLFPKPAH